jgi:hypothetical protein
VEDEGMARRLIGGAVVVAGAVLLGLFAAAPARASDPMTVAMALTSAAQHASPWMPVGFGSVRMVYRWPRGRMIGIADLDHDKFKFVLPDGTIGYAVGSVSYIPDKSDGWIKMDPAHYAGSLPRPPAGYRARPTPDTSPRELPDRNVHGVLMGAYTFQTRVEGDDGHLYPGKIVTMTCLVEKKTQHLRSCSSAGRKYVMTYDRYDDPSNNFTIPPAVLHAREFVFPKVP